MNRFGVRTRKMNVFCLGRSDSILKDFTCFLSLIILKVFLTIPYEQVCILTNFYIYDTLSLF